MDTASGRQAGSDISSVITVHVCDKLRRTLDGKNGFEAFPKRRTSSPRSVCTDIPRMSESGQPTDAGKATPSHLCTAVYHAYGSALHHVRIRCSLCTRFSVTSESHGDRERKRGPSGRHDALTAITGCGRERREKLVRLRCPGGD